MADSTDFAVQQCPRSTGAGGSGATSAGAPLTAKVAKQISAGDPDYPKGNHKLEFNFQLESGEAISDEESFTMVHPDGSEEKDVLSGGSLKRDGVPEGLYQLNFKHIVGCNWEPSTAIGEPTVVLRVTAQGFADGTPVALSLYRRFQHKPLTTISATLVANAASAKYRYKQQLGEVAGGEFVFEAMIGKKLTVSDVLQVDRFPLDSIGGVKQRLKELGYDPGETNDFENAELRHAVKAFQEDNPELVADGFAGPITKRLLEGY